MKHAMLAIIPVLLFLSWSFFGSNSGFNYNAQSYFPSYSSYGYSSSPSFYVHANSGPLVSYGGYGRSMFTMPSYYTTFGNYRYW